MRALSIQCVLLAVATSLWAQSNGPASLKALDFLRGVWALDNNGQQLQTVEFHWSRVHGNPFLVGRHWSGNEGSCPWCITDTALLAWFDPASNQVRVHLTNKTRDVLDFHLAAIGKKSVQFITDAQPGRPTYRLTCTLLATGALSSALETRPKPHYNFVPLIQARFHRR